MPLKPAPSSAATFTEPAAGWATTGPDPGAWAQFWRPVAARIDAELQSRALHPRDAIVLLPFAALLPPLRAALAQAGGWQLRVETTQTLQASLGPPPVAQPGCCCGDAVLDCLTASALLRSQPGLTEWAQRDGALFEHLVASVVDATQAFVAGAAATPVHLRDDFWARARAGIAQSSAGLSAAALETRLLSLALEWAVLTCATAAPASDALYTLRPSAWVVVRLGGPDALADAVAQAGTAPVMLIDLDPASDEVLAPPAGAAAPAAVADQTAATKPAWALRARAAARWLCEDFESEAQAAAACVIEGVNAGRVPVALVAVDRALVRRVRALLDRQRLPLLDETGWLLATTTAGAQVRALLDAALALQMGQVEATTPAPSCPGACRDAVLDWLKGRALGRPVAAGGNVVDPAGAGSTSAGNGARRMAEDRLAVDALESLWRGRRRITGRARAERCWRAALNQLLPLVQASSQPSAPLQSPQQSLQQSLQQWLQQLHHTLEKDGSLQRLDDDPAGRQVLLALRLQGAPSAAWDALAQATRLGLAGFAAWVADTLEQSPYLPVPDEGALVVLTPLSRAYGRPFGQVVVPGADHRQLGSPQTQASLIGPALARLLGLPDDRLKHLQQRLALVHLLQVDVVTFTRRLRNEGEPLSESPDLAWLMQSAQGLPGAISDDGPPPWRAWLPAWRRVTPLPVQPPQPVAANDLPLRLSASQLDAYRQCPYRFFARAVLRLDHPEELDAGLDKRDYGNWLHAVLHHFHSERDYRQAADEQLERAALHITQVQGVDAAELLPWRASFENFSAPYLRWVQQRERDGWFWADGETDHEAAADALPGTRLKGRLDRIDHGPNGEQQVIDYKTGDAASLTRKVKQPLEDTQLVFYAAVLKPAAADDHAHGDLSACYLALDDPKAPRMIEHPNVADSAAQMLQGLGGEWQRLRAGHALLALGEGAVCETCEARGLCRRDHWARPAD